MNLVDIYIQNYISTIRSGGLTEYMYLLTKLFDISVLSVIAFICFMILIKLFRGFRYALLFLFSAILTIIIVYILKVSFGVERPPQAVFEAFSQSFPSYHATMSTVFFVMLMYVFDQYLKPIWRIIFNSICIIFIFLVSFSRIYLGVHWFSDVFVGVLLGVFISYISIKIFKKKFKK